MIKERASHIFGLLRWLAVAAVAVAMGLAPMAAGAQTGSLTGTWQGVYQGVTFELVVQPNGAYSETQRLGAMMTMQQGYIQATGADVVSFVVQDWSPKTMPQYHATGTVGGYYTQTPMAKPPGGTYRLTFNGPGSVTMQDVNAGGVITFQRVG